MKFKIGLVLTAGMLAFGVHSEALDDFWRKSVGRTVRRLPVEVLPENGFVILRDDERGEQGLPLAESVVEAMCEHGTYNVFTVTPRWLRELDHPDTEAMIRRLSAVTRRHGVKFLMDSDVKICRETFLSRYPDDHLDLLMFLPASATNEAAAALCARCPVLSDSLSPAGRSTAATAARVLEVRGEWALVRFRRFSVDIFSPHLLAFSRELMARQKALGADGAMRDEWGLPPTASADANAHRSFFYSDHMGASYRARTGRDFLQDVWALAGIDERADAARVVDDYMRLIYDRNVEIERDFYAANREIFGPEVYVAKHSTWQPKLVIDEFLHNGLSWWAAPRDWAQADEMTPVPACLGMTKKFGGANWMNEGYAPYPYYYVENIWRYALCGGRMVYHPLCPPAAPYQEMPAARRRLLEATDLMSTEIVLAQSRVRLLNLISAAPLDSEVALVFNRSRLVNWRDPAFGEWGRDLCCRLWERGYPVDLYPDEELTNGTFRLDRASGLMQVGKERYRAIALLNVELPAALKGGTKVFDAEADAAKAIAGYLDSVRAVKQTPCVSVTWPNPPGGEWDPVYPGTDGTLTLTDGTVARFKGCHPLPAGDGIDGELAVGGKKVGYRAEGLFAAHVGADGRLDAIAGGGVGRVDGPGLSLRFAVPRDIALRRRPDGTWQGVWQTFAAAETIPAELMKVTGDWTVLIRAR